jgi:hypothetical protein
MRGRKGHVKTPFDDITLSLSMRKKTYDTKSEKEKLFERPIKGF